MIQLTITTPTTVTVKTDDVAHIRGEDETGAFGILPGHADFVTALTPSVVSWRHGDGREGHCAVRGGVLLASGGAQVAIATREAVVSDDLDRLEHEVLASFAREIEEESHARVGSRRLQMRAVRQILAYLRPERGKGR
jgi:F-type H+-transporting ATPase subunit epsilon